MKKQEVPGNPALRGIIEVLIGSIVALGCCLIFLLFCALMMAQGWLPSNILQQLVVAGCIAGTFAGGLFAARRYRGKTLLVGLGVGAVFFLILLTVGILVLKDFSAETKGLPILCGSLCGGALAGLLCAKPQKKHRK
ncbi:MAG: TIGR04086 family membrane protein [Oscillospiraceae bacterium]